MSEYNTTGRNVNCTLVYFRTIGTVIVGVVFVKLMSMLFSIIRRQLQLAPWHVEVVTDDDQRVHPVDLHGVCSNFQYFSLRIYSICNIQIYMSLTVVKMSSLQLCPPVHIRMSHWPSMHHLYAVVSNLTR